MVLIIPQSEKADPPPYTPRDPSALPPLPQQFPQPSSSTTSPGAPPPGAAPPLATRTSSDGSSHPRNPNLLQASAKNYLRVVQVDQDIIGHWTINPALPQSASPNGDGAPAGANVYFQTERARIEATVAWIGASANGEGLPRAKVEALNKRGDISIINTTRPRGLPIHVKAVSLRKGDVRICAPSDFYGILLLRIPASNDWKTRIGLASEIKSQVSCTRETAITRKGKNKMQQAFLLDQADSEEHTLVEILIGSDLEVADFNRAFNAGPGSLDLIEVEIRGEGTRIMILSAEDAALGHEPFPCQPEDEMKNATRNADKSWRVPGVTQGGFTVSFRDRSNRPANHAGGIEIVIDEPPKWMGSFMKMLGKHGDKEKDRDKDKKGCKGGGASGNSSVSQNWGWVTSPQSSTVTLVTPEERAGPPPFPGIGAPGSLSPRSSYDHHRRLSSTSHEDHVDLLLTPAPRSQRSASFGGSSEATFTATSPPIPPIPPRRPTPSPPNQNAPSATPGSPYVYPSVSTSPPPQHPSRSPSDPKVGPRHPDLARGVPRIISPPLGSPPPSESKRVPYSRHGHSYSMDDLREAINGGSSGREQVTSPVEFGGNEGGGGGRQGSSRHRGWQEQASRVAAAGGLSFGRDLGPYRYPYGTMPLPSASTSSSRGGNTRGRWDPDLTRERWNSSRNHQHGHRNGQALPPPPPLHPSAQQTRMSPPPLPISTSRSPGPGSPKNRYPGHPQRPSTSPTTATNHQRGASNPWPASSSSSSSSPPPAASSAWAQWQQRGATIPQPSSPAPSSNSGGSTASGRDGRNRLVKVRNRNQSTPDLRGGGGLLKRGK